MTIELQERDARSGDTVQRLLSENLALRGTVRALSARMEELERLADSDTLTPLPNRRLFERELERAVGRVSRYGTPATLLFVDVDGLKRINDFHGHLAGDRALIHVANILQANIRQSDIAARIAGDEFGVILDNLGEGPARAKAAALAAEVRANPLPNGIALSVSIGVTALVPNDRRDSALGRADGDMYRARRSG